MRNSFGKHLSEYMSSNSKHHLFCGDIGFKIFDEIQKNTPSQFHNFGISEQHMVSFAASFATRLATTSVLYTISPFITSRVHDQLRVDVAYSNSPLVITSVGAGFSYDNLGFTHFGLEDLALITSLPNFLIRTPCDPSDIPWILNEIFSKNMVSNPFYLRLQKGGEPNLDDEYGKSTYENGARNWHGSDITVIGHGHIIEEALKARVKLRDVASLHVISVVSWEKFLSSCEGLIKKPIIILEENCYAGSLASFLLKKFIKYDKCNVLKILNIENATHEGMISRRQLLKKYDVDSDSIVNSIKAF